MAHSNFGPSTVLLFVISHKTAFLTLSEGGVLCGEKLGHPWSGTVFWIPASEVSAEATEGWVSFCSMHNFFDGCR